MTEQRTQIMGILNVTPDSFYDGGRFSTFEAAIARAKKMWEEGADILDIGGESTRPGSEEVPEEEELKRVIPVIRALKSLLPIPLSIDTQKPRVAEAALAAGASFLNDVSGFRDPAMVELAKHSQADLCVMHMLETPKTMQLNPVYEEGVVRHLEQWFHKKSAELMEQGISRERILFDPGIGFGKTVDDNLKILHNLEGFRAMGFRVLIGLSRKSFISKIVHKPSQEILPATLAMNTIALLAKVDIIRVHDVREHRESADVIARYLGITKQTV